VPWSSRSAAEVCRRAMGTEPTDRAGQDHPADRAPARRFPGRHHSGDERQSQCRRCGDDEEHTVHVCASLAVGSDSV
jgi:hypothetical protein